MDVIEAILAGTACGKNTSRIVTGSANDRSAFLGDWILDELVRPGRGCRSQIHSGTGRKGSSTKQVVRITYNKAPIALRGRPKPRLLGVGDYKLL
jgi:hypothetical protein